MKHPICNTCGMPAVGNYIETSTDKSKNSIVCENCLNPKNKMEQIDFEEWWEQYEKYNKALKQAIKKRNKKLDKVVIK